MCAWPHLNVNTGCAKPRKALAADLGVGVFYGRNYFANSGVDERVATRPSAPVVRTGFKRDISGRALGCVAVGECVLQGHDFCVGPACGLGEALANGLALRVDQNATDAWVGRTEPQGLGGEGEGRINGGQNANSLGCFLGLSYFQHSARLFVLFTKPLTPWWSKVKSPQASAAAGPKALRFEVNKKVCEGLGVATVTEIS